MKWLHLSDIHYNPKMDGRSSEQLREKLPLFFEEQNIKVNEIFITGDFRHAFFQKDEDISAVAKQSVEYIKKIAASVGISSMKNIHIVPGNHDLTRNKNKILWEIAQHYNYDNGSFTQDNLSFLQDRFDFFRCICRELYESDSFYQDLCTRVHTYRLVNDHIILYINTALVCGIDNERGNLVIGNYYLYQALESIKKDYPDKQIIVLAHHAVENFSKREREIVEQLFSEYRVSLYLCGDAHEIWCRKINQYLEITVGCIVQKEGMEAVFCLGDTEANTVTAYHWDAKFSCWSEYVGFNQYMQKLVGHQITKPRKFSDNITSIHNLPKLPKNYRISEPIKNIPFQILTNERLVYISGISGIGKTLLSIKLANELQSKVTLDSIYFINGSQIISAQGLYSVDLEMVGSKVNLLGMIKSDHSLFIIDDLQQDIDNIIESIWDKLQETDTAYVIATSQINSRFSLSKNVEYSLSFLTDQEQIMEILNWRLLKDRQCPKELVSTIKEKTNGHPLLLNSLRSLIQYDDANWQDIIEEELDDFLYHEVEDGKLFINKILYRHQNVLEKELYSIKWLKSKYISEPLLTKLITKEGIRKLESRSFVQRSNEIIKVHDIIYDCISKIICGEQATERYNQQLNIRFYEYFNKERSNKSSAYFKALHLHEGKIISLAKEKKEPGVEWYFYSQAFPNDDFNIFNSFSYTQEDCALWITNNQAEYIIGTVLELMESESRKNKHTNTYGAIMYDRTQTLKFLLTKILAKTDLYRDITHHLGKLYRNIGEMDKAKECFEEVLKQKPDSYETKLQLIRLHKNEKILSTESIINQYSSLLDVYIKGMPISMSIVLAAYGDLYSFDKNGLAKTKYFFDKFDYFMKAISSMAVEAFDQPYNVLALTLKFYTFNYPDKLISLVNNLPIPSVEMINKKNYFDIAQVYKETGKAIMWSEELSKTKYANTYFATAEDFYQLIDAVQLNNDYRCVQRAENLILLERHAEAVNFLNDYKFVDNAFWNYRLGQALAAGSENDMIQAAQYLQAAIDLCKQETHLSSFYHAKANVIAKMNDPCADYYYQEALKKCNTAKYRKQIEDDMKTHLKSHKI